MELNGYKKKITGYPKYLEHKKLLSKEWAEYNTVLNAVYFIEQNPAYQKDLLPIILDKMNTLVKAEKEDTNFSEVSNLVYILGRSCQDNKDMINEYIVNTIKEPHICYSAIEKLSGDSKFYNEMVDIIVDSGDLDLLIPLLFKIEHYSNGSKYETVAKKVCEVAKANKDNWTLDEKWNFYSLFYNRVIENSLGKFDEYKKEIIDDVLFDIVSPKRILKLYYKEPKLVDIEKLLEIDKDASLMDSVLYEEELFDVFSKWDIDKQKEYVATAICNRENDLIKSIIAKSDKLEGLIDIELLQKRVIESGALYYAMNMLKKFDGVDIKKISDLVLEKGNFEYNYEFAKEHPEIDIDKHLNRMFELSKSTSTYKEKEFSDYQVESWKVQNDNFVDKLYGGNAYRLTMEQSRREMEKKEHKKYLESVHNIEDQQGKIMEIMDLQRNIWSKRNNQLINQVKEKPIKPYVKPVKENALESDK